MKTEMLTLFGWVSMQSLAGYIIVGYMFSHLVRSEGYSMFSALLILIVAHVVAMVALPITGRIADATGRRQFAVLLSLALGIWMIPAFVLLGHGLVAAMIALAGYAVLQYSTNMVSGWQPSNSTRSMCGTPRAQCPSRPARWSSAAFVSTWLVDATGSKLSPAIYLMLMCALAAVVAWRFIPRARTMDVSSTGHRLHGPEDTETVSYGTGSSGPTGDLR